MDESSLLCEFLEESECGYIDDILSVLEANCWETSHDATFQDSQNHPQLVQDEAAASSPKRKRQKLVVTSAASTSQIEEEKGEEEEEEAQKKLMTTTSHITVERNRRKQMNHHLSVLRSLMPSFYVKRGDQASIIGGVIDYINELQQLLQSLQSKKQRKAYTEVLSPRPVPSPRKPPISPRTPQSSSPYKPWGFLVNSPSSLPSPVDQYPSPCNSSTSSINDVVNELVATSKSAVADVEVKFAGPNLLLKTVSHRIPGQAVKIVAALEQLDLEILHVDIKRVDERMLNSFTIKIGIECQLSAEELAQQIQQTFC